MKKYILLLPLCFLFFSCKTTKLENNDSLTLALENVTANLNGTIKIESINGFISNATYSNIKSRTEKFLIANKYLVLKENYYSIKTDYSLFFNLVRVDYGYNVNLKVTDNNKNEILSSYNFFLSNGESKNYSINNHNPTIEILLIAIMSGIIFFNNI